MQLSVVVPVYKQGKTIKNDLAAITLVLSKANIDFEIICVIDGGDESKFLKNSKNVKVLRLPGNFGKGYAVNFGMKKAKGEAVAFIDAGGEINPELLVFFWHFMKATNADIIVGSKLHPASMVSYPAVRKILSWGYQMLTRVLFGLWVRDTQVGIKMFKKEVVKKVTPRLLVKSYAFDVEFLAVSLHLGFNKIYEAPISLKWRGGLGLSSKKIWVVILRMMWDTMAVFYRLRILKYYDRFDRKIISS
jgi:glycosyltransferase involved in cell wall biosynthesis